MKKTLFKIAFVAVLSLSAMCKAQPDASLNPFDFFKSTAVLSTFGKKDERFSHFLAMGTQENLKAYHLGLRSLFPAYHIPSAQDLFESIRSHSNFLGFLTQDEAIDELNTAKGNFAIFEEKNKAEAHFYVIHAEGLRHFTVNEVGFASIDNSQAVRYPSLAGFLESTAIS